MGTNFYRIAKKDEFAELKKKLLKAYEELDDFSFARQRDLSEELIDYDWKDEEGNKLVVHLGKRSAGWKFLWNFHRNKFYSNKEELLAFIRSGRVFSEYGEEQDVEEFIDMALNWCPDGHDSYNPAPCYDFKTGELLPQHLRYGIPHDTYIDGLRIATHQEHSTYFS